MRRYFVLLFAILLISFCSNDTDGLFSHFEKIKLPMSFISEDYSIYKLFENKPDIDSTDLKYLGEKQKAETNYKYGYILATEPKFKILLYQKSIGEDTVFFIISTLGPKDALISSLHIMELCGDDFSVNGAITEDYKITTTHRELLPRDKIEKDKIKIEEYKIKYEILKETGEIELVSKTSPQIKYYSMDAKGEYIPYQK